MFSLVLGSIMVFLSKGVSAFWNFETPRWRLKRMVGKRYQPSKQKGLRCSVLFTAYRTLLPVGSPWTLEAAHKAAKEEREQRAVHARKEREEVRDAAWLGKFCECLWFCLRKLQGGPIRFLHVPNTEAGRCKNNYILGQKFLMILYMFQTYINYDSQIFRFKYHLLIFGPCHPLTHPTLWFLGADTNSRATPAETASKAAWTQWVEVCLYHKSSS